MVAARRGRQAVTEFCALQYIRTARLVADCL